VVPVRGFEPRFDG